MIDEDLFDKLPMDQKIEIVENSLREDYIFSEMCDMIDKIKPTLEIEAEKRRKAGAKLAPGKEKFKVRDILATYLKVSHGQVEKIEDIKNAVKENPDKFGHIPEQIENGLSIEYAHNMITTTIKAETPTPDLPDEEFEVVVIDFGWDYDQKLSGSPKYKTMTLEEIKKEFPKLPLAKNAVVLIWTTNPKLREAFELIDFYELEYKTNIVWVKTKDKKRWSEDEIIDTKTQQGTGHYIKGSHELLLIATKGNLGLPPHSARISSVVFAERTRKHSQKPAIFKKIINDFWPGKKKLEMFSRERGPYHNDTWSYFGDELEAES